MVLCSKTHLDALRKYDSFLHISRKACTIFLCLGGSSSVAMRTSSMYTNSSFGCASMSERRMRLMVLAKVAGAVVRPKVITLGMNSPLGVLKAALSWSSSFILMLWYPHRMSNLENTFLPLRFVMISEMRGSEYVSFTVHALRGL